MALNLLASPRSASNAINDPSGDQAASPLVPFESVSSFTPEPSALMRKTSFTRRWSFGVRSLRAVEGDLLAVRRPHRPSGVVVAAVQSLRAAQIGVRAPDLPMATAVFEHV